MEIKKYILVPNSHWVTFQDDLAKGKIDHKISQLLPVKRTHTKKYNEYKVDQCRQRSKTSFENIQDFLLHAKKFVDQEKFLPINLKRAIVLSDVFTEKRNQLKFQAVLNKMEKEISRKEIQRSVAQQEIYEIEKLKKKEEDLNNKLLMSKNLRNEISELKLNKIKKKTQQIEEEREEILKIKNQLEEENKNTKIKILDTKRIIDKMHQDDVREKLQQIKFQQDLEKKEYELAKNQSEFLYKIDNMRRSKDKAVRIRKPPKVDAHLNTEKEYIKRYYDLPLVKRSKLEEKRDLYRENLKQDRVKGYEAQMSEIHKRKVLEKDEKLTEYKRRCENIHVTSLFKQLQRHNVLEKIKEYRSIWNNQLEERKLAEDKSKQEDIERREKLVQKIRQEDEEYVNTVKTILDDYKKRGKIIEPLIKCLKSGYC